MRHLHLALLLAASAAAAPPVIHRVIPRDAIPAIHAPEFVDPEQAELSPDDAVMGYARRGEAHVYSLDLLNHHEIVNDVVGGEPIAATW